MIIRTRTIVLIVIAIALNLFFGLVPKSVDESLNRVTPHSPYQVSEETQHFHQSLVIADMHADATLWNRNLTERHNYGHTDLPRMREGNQALQVFTTVTKSPRGQNYERNTGESLDNITLLSVSQLWPPRTWTNLTERALYQAERLHELALDHPDQFMLVRSKTEMNNLLSRRASGEQVIGGIIGTEGSHALEGELDNIHKLYRSGFRMMSLHHFFDNRLGGSLHGLSSAGLTDFGREVVKKINEMPIILDLSHSSEAVVREVLALSNKPLVISHTGTNGHCNSPRNIPDPLMQEIASRGGLIGIGYWDAICDTTPKGIAKAIQAAVALLGENHVALGSDFDGAVQTGIDVSELPAVTQALLDIGVSKSIIEKVMGKNLIRLFYQQLPQ